MPRVVEVFDQGVPEVAGKRGISCQIASVTALPPATCSRGNRDSQIEKTGIHPPSVTPGNQPLPSSTRVIACNEERGARNLGYYPGSVARPRAGGASRVSPRDRRRIPRRGRASAGAL